MQAWTMSALDAYYRDPPVLFQRAGARRDRRAAITVSGFYIEPHCEPGCCGDFRPPNGLLGPFVTAALARRWSRQNLSNAPLPRSAKRRAR